MLTMKEAAAHLGIHETTLVRWAEHGIIKRHAYNGHYYLYELPESPLPAKHCSRWDRLRIGRTPSNSLRLKTL